MDKSNKYSSYFDEEELNDTNTVKTKESPNKYSPDKVTKSPSTSEIYKVPKSKPKSDHKDFAKPDPPSVNRRIIKDVKDFKESDLEQLYSQYFDNVENYESLNELNEDLEGDEDMEYELVDVNDLEKLMGHPYSKNIQMETKPLNKQIEELELEFQEDKQNFEILSKLINLYKKNKNIDQLERMREYTNSLYPLGEDMWNDWLNEKIAEKSNCEFEQLYKLINTYFDRAINDFYCNYFLILDLKICKKYVKFLIRLKIEAESKNISIIENYPLLTIENIRSKFEEFLEFWGLDFNMSSRLWDLYLNFEKINLEKYKEAQDQQNYQQTINLIRSIYRRRLSFPHIDGNIIWNEYKKWEKDENELSKVESKYIESSKKAEEMINFEEKINELLDKTNSEDNSTVLCEFLKLELQSRFKKQVNYIRLFFEKALSLNPDDDELWKAYLEVLKNINPNSKLTYSLLKRACKCCYFSVVFWVLLLREMEKLQLPYEEIQLKTQEAFASSGDDENFISEIWKYSLEYLCRNYNDENIQIRETFSSAINDIQNRGNKEYIIKILHIWVEFEVYKAKSKELLNDLMNRIVKLEPTSDNWKSYLNYEKYFGDQESIRKIYKRALEYCKEEKDVFSESWIMWEKINGKVSDIEYALNYSKSRVLSKKPKMKLSLKSKGEMEVEKVEEKEEEVTMEDAPVEEDKNINNSNKTVIIKNISSIANEQDIENFINEHISNLKIKDIRIVRDKKGISKCFSFVDFYNVEDAQECASVLNDKILDENLVSCAISKPPKLGDNDSRTIFINNISYDSTEERIKSAFESFGKILDVRIIYDKVSNRPKGYCYVEFADEKSAEKVLSSGQNFIIDKRKVIVKSSQSCAKLRENIKYVAHVSNLPFSTTDKKLIEFFNKNEINKISDCLINTDEEGNSKGFGFVQFEDEDNLNKALKLTGKSIKGRPITIKLSTRNITRNEKKRKSSNSLESEVVVKKQKIEIAENKTNEDFVRNSKQKHETLSNNDFRKFLK